MNLCSDDHEEVCYEVKNCPVCEERQKTAKADGTIEDLRAKISDLGNELDTAQSDLEAAEAQVKALRVVE